MVLLRDARNVKFWAIQNGLIFEKESGKYWHMQTQGKREELIWGFE